MSDTLPPQLQTEVDLLRTEMREIVGRVDSATRARNAEGYVGKLLFLVQRTEEIERTSAALIEAIRRLHRVSGATLPPAGAIEESKDALDAFLEQLRGARPSEAARILRRAARSFE
jgi:hypothetical protein